MRTLFVSDLHLCGERPEKLDLFYQFIAGPARQADALYILGDLFEVWVGDDDTTAPGPQILGALASLSGAGISLYMMPGNRDFLIGSRFHQLTGCTLLPDPVVVKFYGVKTLLMHGDLLCTNDVEYQIVRREVRTPQWRRKALRMPLFWRKLVAKKLRRDSKNAMREKAPQIMDVDHRAVEAVMSEHGVTRLIHGHTHRPAIHQFKLKGKTAERIVLGDWYVNDSVLVLEPDKYELRRVEEIMA